MLGSKAIDLSLTRSELGAAVPVSDPTYYTR